MHGMPTYLIDGHNLLYAARQGFLDHLVDGHPGGAAREDLVRCLVATFVDADQAVFLYFDGSEATTEIRSARVQVIYPGGPGDQRADAAILRHVAQLAAAGEGTPIIVVTRDLKLARRARKRGAGVIAPGEFLAAKVIRAAPATPVGRAP